MEKAWSETFLVTLSSYADTALSTSRFLRANPFHRFAYCVPADSAAVQLTLSLCSSKSRWQRPVNCPNHWTLTVLIRLTRSSVARASLFIR